MPRRYAILDVFTDTPLAGNPLAVVLDAEDLDSGQMQAIAREFNLSETVFVRPSENPAQSADIRIFTPGRELPFAGHPTVGTAVLLASERFPDVDSELDVVEVLKEKVGTVRCGVRLFPDKAGYAEFDAPRLPQGAGTARDKELIAAALGLEPREIGFENHKPSLYEAGVPFTLVPVAGLDAIARAQPVVTAWKAAFGQGPANDVFVYCRETLHTTSAFHARMFAPMMGIPEDPATGSAAAAFAGAIHSFDGLTDGTHHFHIEQGYEMGRPSTIDLEIDVDKRKISAMRIGGSAVIVARGELTV
ncbi:MAG: phenazine biosynthesis protein PhzF [Hyphomicrobiales bacterium]|nr:MAG: phenazine biosynthesis protein PhzF [Hyphomicrobiales bacterium]